MGKIQLKKHKNLLDYLIRYALTSGLAVGLEIVFFYVLFINGCSVFLSNAFSCTFGAMLGWIIGGQTLFKEYGIRKSKYALWFLYQAFAIVAYSFLAKLIFSVINIALITKILVLAISFAINSIVFKNFILVKTIDDQHQHFQDK